MQRKEVREKLREGEEWKSYIGARQGGYVEGASRLEKIGRKGKGGDGHMGGTESELKGKSKIKSRSK